jgi:hypothetical protein
MGGLLGRHLGGRKSPNVKQSLLVIFHRAAPFNWPASIPSDSISARPCEETIGGNDILADRKR